MFMIIVYLTIVIILRADTYIFGKEIDKLSNFTVKYTFNIEKNGKMSLSTL